MASTPPGQRRLQILQALAAMLEQPKGEKITTAALAARLAVSEAALYRHFASKAQMFEGLIEFIESSVFGLINQITEKHSDGLSQTRDMVGMLLNFAISNPGMTRVLIGDALVNEDERLQVRMNQFYDRVELALKQASARGRHRRPWQGKRSVGARHPAGQLRHRPLAPLRQERLQDQSVPGSGAANRHAAGLISIAAVAMRADCYALLDDAASPGAGSRLYTGLAGVLRCDAIEQWPALLDGLQAALQRGLYAVTVCSYELGAHLLAMPPRAADRGTPCRWRRCCCSSTAGTCRSRKWRSGWQPRRRWRRHRPALRMSPPISSGRQFTQALARIHDYIAAGDTYQVNYTYRLRFDAFGAPAALYARLRARQPVPYGALVMLPDGGALLSLSPELFVRHAQGELTARPMKGTAPAAPADQEEENTRRAQALSQDPKNRAENLMIVDLLRNDIGRIADTGTVRVPALFEVKRYSSVLQMTSTVQARLRQDASTGRYLPGAVSVRLDHGRAQAAHHGNHRRTRTRSARACIPARSAGSIRPPRMRLTRWATSACRCRSAPWPCKPPDAASGTRRGEMGVGAGIVHDSVADEEYAECQLKARFLTGLSNDFELFETLHASRLDGCRQQARHLARLRASASLLRLCVG